jgi:hypothetical protein
MKVGIMSMQRIVNFGSFMQALALKQIIEGLGHEVVFVDYHVGPCIDTEKSIKNRIINLYGAIKANIGNSELIRQYKLNHDCYDERFLNFYDCYKLLGINYKNRYNEKVDVLIIGSDEVFNCFQKNPRVGFSKELFGKNNNSRKLISYAASFGSTTYSMIVENKKNVELERLLNRFDGLSVRDDNSISIIDSICSTIPLRHLDPVIVGNVEKLQWKDVSVHSKYVLVYGYKNRFSSEEGNAICEFAKRRNCVVLSVGEEQSFGKNIVCRPDEILSYFSKANYIVTDTFHGTIFSVIYKKPMAVFCRDNKKYNSTNLEKMKSLLHDLHLEQLVVKNVEDIENILSQNIDYSTVDDVRDIERKRTEEYFRKYLVSDDESI